MKYMIAIYSDPVTWGHPTFLHASETQGRTQEERDQMTRQFEELLEEITASGELVGGEALADPVTVQKVRVRDGAVAVTDGPFAEAKEQLAGFFLVDCESIERAIEIASRFPNAQFEPVEVRPVMNLSGQEM